MSNFNGTSIKRTMARTFIGTDIPLGQPGDLWFDIVAGTYKQCTSSSPVTWVAFGGGGGGGTVTSVGVSSSGSYSAALTIGSSPVTTSGTITITANLFGTSSAGVVPSSGGGTANFLRADGTWALPVAAAGTLTGTTLASGVITSSLTTVGTIGTGTWQGTVVGSTYGGTGVNNAGRTLTISTNSGTISYTGAATTLTVAATASVSGTNTGDQTTISGNAGTATALQTGRTFSATGDATGTSAAFDGSANASIPLTLATVNASPQADQFRKLTVNGKGLVTATTAVSGSDMNTAFGSQTANFFYAAPNGSASTPSFRAIVAADIPTLNQNTTGSAASATTATNATNTAVTNDNATNATMYPTWVTTTTGNLPQNLSSTKLTFNPSSGTLTATTFVGALTGNATTATNIAAGTTNQIPYQTAAGATSFYSAANYGVQTYGATGVPASVAGAAGVLQGSASAIPTFTTTPTLTGTNFSGIGNGALTNSSVTVGTTAISLGSSSTSLGGLTTLSMNNQLTNSLAIGTAPFVITSTTRVANLNVATAGTADTLTTSRNINGTAFNGSADITVTAAAGTLTGTTLNSTVVSSSLTSVGTLSALAVTGTHTQTGALNLAGASSPIQLAGSAGTSGQVLSSAGAGATPTWQTVSGTGTVTSVGAIGNNGISISGSPVTTAGSITFGLGNITPTGVLASGAIESTTGNMGASGAANVQFYLTPTSGHGYQFGYNGGSAIGGFYDVTAGAWRFYFQDSDGAMLIPTAGVASSTTTGAVRITGGVGIGGAVYAASLQDNGNRVMTSLSGTTNQITVSGSAPAGVTVALAQPAQSITAASAGINTSETVLKTLTVGTTLAAGDAYIIEGFGTCTSTVANLSTFTVRIGTAGTTADGTINTVTCTAAASGTTIGFYFRILLTIRTTGSPGTAIANGVINNAGVTGISAVTNAVSANSATGSVTTGNNNIISIAYKSAATTTTSTFQNVAIYKVR